MKIDPERSVYQEASDVHVEFSPAELRRCRLLLRRLRFLEAKVRESGGISNAHNNGGAWAEMEIDALEWVLTHQLGFLSETRRKIAS